MFKLIPIPNLVFLVVLLICGGTWTGEAGENQRRIMTWVPPYGVEACQERMNQSFDGIGMKDGLTHLGLQFWTPTQDGGIKLVDRFGVIEEKTISDFRAWGATNRVKVLLCVYNGTPSGWDWELARTAFDDNRSKFIDSLVQETLRLKLDGVDIDLEGNGDLKGSRTGFLLFIKELSRRLRAEGKELTVNSFAYKWHAPNQGWWAELLPHLDGLHVMGYSETGAEATDWRSYDFLKAAAGNHASKLLIGMPGDAAEWQKKPAREHLAWIVQDTEVGLAIWDARVKDPAWRAKDTWQAIAKIKNGAGQGGSAEPTTRSEALPEADPKPQPESEERSR